MIEAATGCLSLKVAAPIISASKKAVDELVKRGLLQSIRKRSPRSGRLGTYVTLNAIDKFDDEFVSLRRLASLKESQRPDSSRGARSGSCGAGFLC